METKPLRLSFFWHMHQPDYRGKDGVMKMPWVFLHAIKDYYDMPWLLSRFPTLKATFNLTPSLIEQLNLCQDPLKNDYFLNLWYQHPSMLDQNTKEWILKLMKATQYETMVKPLQRFAELYDQPIMGDEEIIELEVLFMLAWCGGYLRLNNETVRRLLAQGRGYLQHDKTELLQSLRNFITEILPLYASLQSQGVISVSTTPYFHPILPLLIDMNTVLISHPSIQIPKGAFSLEEDAQEHIRRSIELYTQTFGSKPKGFWPSEGAVDEKSIELYHREGIEWIATDETLLRQSLRSDDPALRYRVYEHKGMKIVFRDRALSDLIGFEYRHRSGAEASCDFMEQLKRIAREHSDPVVSVIVDGENAWEFYPDNGSEFFEALYSELSGAAWCRTVTMDEVSCSSNPKILSSLHPGSWIHGTFDTWVGDVEKNRAWELIFKTRRDAAAYLQNVDEGISEKIRYHFLASECSDWFWWYGVDHVSDFVQEFDGLFRSHLIEIYRLLDRPIPAEILEPIHRDRLQNGFWKKPSNPISPKIDGASIRIMDWLGCGRIDARYGVSTMEKTSGSVNIIYYGYDADALYFAFEGDFSALNAIGIRIYIEGIAEPISISPTIKAHRIEALLPRNMAGEHSMLQLRFVIMAEGKEVQSMPEFGLLMIDLNDTFITEWFI